MSLFRYELSHPTCFQIGLTWQVQVEYMKAGTFVCLIILLPVFAFLGESTPSGLSYLDSTWVDGDYEQTKFVEITDSHIIAAHDDTLVVYNISDNTILKSFTFPEMSSISVSANGEFIAVNRAYSTEEPKSLQIINLTSLELLSTKGYSDSDSKDISWHPDTDHLAAPGKDGDVKILRRSDMSVKNTLGGVHNVEVTCIEYRSDGEYLITGDEAGRYAIWNKDGSLFESYRTLQENEGILDCKWSPDGEDFVLLGDNGIIVSRSLTGGLNGETVIDGAMKIEFSQVGHIIHVGVDNNSFKGIKSLTFSSLQEEYETNFFHRINDFEIIDNEFGRMSSIYVASNVGEVAIYHKEFYFDGYLEPGVDTDFDKIPDNIDEDDDGDGIIDQWDDNFGCDAPTGVNCSLYPDLLKIRNVEFEFLENNLIIHDTITLPTHISSDIRNLSRNSLAKDQIISSNEKKFFANAVCNNMVKSELFDAWESSIVLSTGELGDATVDCRVADGLEGVKDGDSVTQIKLIISINFEIKSDFVFPLNLTLSTQVGPTTGSISWISPNHPISVKITGKNVVEQEVPIWRNDGMNLVFEIEEYEEIQTTTTDQILEFITNPIVIVFVIISIVLPLIIFKKRVSNYKLDLDNFSEPEEIEDEDDEIEEYVDDYDIEEDLPDAFSDREDDDEFEEDIPRNTSIKETNKESVDQKTRKRKVSIKQETNEHRPITKTKRKKLSSVTENVEDTVIVKKKTVKKATEEKTVKKKTVKKKVKTELDKTIEKQENISTDNEKDLEGKSEKKKERRKPVRRKSNSSEKLIDETSLQENLLDEFTGE